ncbi:uncharacterized protein MONBRDRAFT_29945 [Monosiga brevicollis MX1]|uniref:Uncharacterized protein n=1 Tax=Monosiga brevicollis TaxID=81824 RepID=A9VCK5_MONBE|nr:uncharacterized protein MONBRDRAFT_29945 [Monosiga brevicollis MX1]EDQ84802.1 predicted protein [Monosiga brevicollis MX1]|eukprot:XP_001750452.1 hypothetical protein [Monosiga brevicollis MX1]
MPSRFSSGHAETCQALLRYNCDVDALCRNHSSPLALAARAGHVGCMRVLIHHDATVDLKNLRRETILHFICGRPNVKRQAVKMLIEAGADVNAQSLESRTCLRAAAYAGNAEAASLLLCAGANPTIHNNSDASPLAVARQRGHGDVEQVLLAVDLFHTGLPETGVPTLEALCVARARTMHAEAGHDHRVLLANRLPLACKRLLVLNNPYLSRDLNLIAERS